MAFTVDDYQDLLALLREHPEWQAPLRDLLVGAQFARLEGALDRLEAAVAENGRQIEELRTAVAENTRQIEENSRQIEENSRQIEQNSRQIEENGRQIAALTEALKAHEAANAVQLARLEGWAVEHRLINNGRSLLGLVLRKAVVISIQELDALRPAIQAGRVSRGEANDLVHADVFFRGLDDRDDREVVVVVEASQTVDMSDLDRAERRAATLKRIGYRTIPMVAGDSIRPEDRRRAEERGIAVMIGGTVENWPDAA